MCLCTGGDAAFFRTPQAACGQVRPTPNPLLSMPTCSSSTLATASTYATIWSDHLSRPGCNKSPSTVEHAMERAIEHAAECAVCVSGTSRLRNGTDAACSLAPRPEYMRLSLASGMDPFVCSSSLNKRGIQCLLLHITMVLAPHCLAAYLGVP